MTDDWPSDGMLRGWMQRLSADAKPAKEVFGTWHPTPEEQQAAGRRAGKMQALAKEMAKRKATDLDEGIAAFVRAGVPIERIEVVHETYSRGDDHTTIHQRAYVRVREER